MRLNPITKNEPDYRLFIVHMLVGLRTLGQALYTTSVSYYSDPFPSDDRAVSEDERKAALKHFNSDQVMLLFTTSCHGYCYCYNYIGT